MSKVIIDMGEFTHLKEQSVYNHNYYRHNQFDYTILQKCDEEFNTLHFYAMTSTDNVFLFSCQYPYDDTKIYEGDLGFFWS